MKFNPLGFYEKLNVVRFIKSATKICTTEKKCDAKNIAENLSFMSIPEKITIHYTGAKDNELAVPVGLPISESEFRKLFPSVTDPLWISGGKRYFCYFNDKKGLHYIVFSNKGRLLLQLITFHPQSYPLQFIDAIKERFKVGEIYLLKKIITRSQCFYEIVVKNDGESNIFESFQFKNTSHGLQFVDKIFCINDIIDLKNKIITNNEPSKN